MKLAGPNPHLIPMQSSHDPLVQIMPEGLPADWDQQSVTQQQVPGAQPAAVEGGDAVAA
jgi:hypothetical protein